MKALGFGVVSLACITACSTGNDVAGEGTGTIEPEPVVQESTAPSDSNESAEAPTVVDPFGTIEGTVATSPATATPTGSLGQGDTLGTATASTGAPSDLPGAMASGGAPAAPPNVDAGSPAVAGQGGNMGEEPESPVASGGGPTSAVPYGTTCEINSVPVALCFEKEYPDGLPEGQAEARPSENVDLEMNLLEMGEGPPTSGCDRYEHLLTASTARWLRLTDDQDSAWLLAFDVPEAASIDLELGETLNVSFRAGPDVERLGTFHQSALVLSRVDEPLMFIADGSYTDDVAALVADVAELSREEMVCESYNSECGFRYWALRLRIGDQEGILDPAQGLARIGDFTVGLRTSLDAVDYGVCDGGPVLILAGVRN